LGENTFGNTPLDNAQVNNNDTVVAFLEPFAKSDEKIADEPSILSN
jgi:hypothetical protein